MYTKRVLVFAGKLGYQTRSFDAAARKLGVELAFVTDRCHQLEDPWGDRAIAVHFESPEVAAYTVLEEVRRNSQRPNGQRVDGILGLGDRPAVAAAYVARGLGLTYNHPAAVEACRSKLRMRELFRDAGLRVPWFRAVALQPAPEPALLGISYPCVLKPLSLSASTGVIRANNREEFLRAAARVRGVLESPEIMASREAKLGKIARCAVDAVRALGLSHGPVHAEFRINEEGVWPLEVAPRPIGGLCARALRFVSDGSEEVIGLEELLLRHAVEMPVGNWKREAGVSGVMMIPVPASGVLERVEGESAARAVPSVTDWEIAERLHDYIAAWPEGASYLGFLFARAATVEEVEGALRAEHGEFRFAIRERLAVEHPATGRVVG